MCLAEHLRQSGRWAYNRIKHAHDGVRCGDPLGSTCAWLSILAKQVGGLMIGPSMDMQCWCEAWRSSRWNMCLAEHLGQSGRCAYYRFKHEHPVFLVPALHDRPLLSSSALSPALTICTQLQSIR